MIETPPLYLVVNVGHVHDVLDFEVKIMHHDAPDDIAGHIVSRMAEMTLVVDCRAAGVPRHLARLHGDKRHRRTWLERVVDLEGLHDGGAVCSTGGTIEAAGNEGDDCGGFPTIEAAQTIHPDSRASLCVPRDGGVRWLQRLGERPVTTSD